jgi:hypothetical protein
MRGRDDGTVIPLLVLGFLLAGTLLAAAVAGSAALVAHRRLAADCDGAALAGASALDRPALAGAPTLGGPTVGGSTVDGPTLDGSAPDRPALAGGAGRKAALPGPGNADGTGDLPLDPVAAARAVAAYLEVAAPGTTAAVKTDRTTVTVVCRRTVRVPFGAVIARPHGIRETATARAGTVLRPST